MRERQDRRTPKSACTWRPGCNCKPQARAARAVLAGGVLKGLRNRYRTSKTGEEHATAGERAGQGQPQRRLVRSEGGQGRAARLGSKAGREGLAVRLARSEGGRGWAARLGSKAGREGLAGPEGWAGARAGQGRRRAREKRSNLGCYFGKTAIARPGGVGQERVRTWGAPSYAYLTKPTLTVVQPTDVRLRETVYI